MTTVIDGTTGVNRITDGTVVQADLATNVAGNGPAVIASPTLAQSFTPTGTKVLLQQVDKDTAASFSSSRFAPSVAGYYQINAAIYFSTPNTTLGGGTLILYKTGVQYQKVTSLSNVGQGSYCTAGWLVYLDGVSDYIELWASQSGVASSTTLANRPDLTYFCGVLVRAA